MNIFSRFLSQWSKEPRLNQFIERWDIVEALAIQTYRQKKVDPAAAERYRASRAWLIDHYDDLAGPLTPFWEKSLVGGTSDHADPFLFVLEVAELDGFLGNWAALQHLPAAREALNQLLIADP